MAGWRRRRASGRGELYCVGSAGIRRRNWGNCLSRWSGCISIDGRGREQGKQFRLQCFRVVPSGFRFPHVIDFLDLCVKPRKLDAKLPRSILEPKSLYDNVHRRDENISVLYVDELESGVGDELIEVYQKEAVTVARIQVTPEVWVRV